MGLFQDRKRKVGVVDIIVTDRNLHRPFLFDRAVYEPTAKALGSWRTDMHNSGATGTCGRARSNGICQGSIPEREPADGHRACQLAETQTSARRHFFGSTSNKRTPLVYLMMGLPEIKTIRATGFNFEVALTPSWLITTASGVR
jgi:hypothetical protein